MRAAWLPLLALFEVVASRPAHAGVEIVTWLPGDDGVVLVGASGELYVADEEETLWRRQQAGGVAVDVRAAFRDGSGDIYAMGSRSPVFRRGEHTWHARQLPNRGSVAAGGAGGDPVIAVGRHIYEPRGARRWIRRGATRDRVVAVWGGGGTRVYVSEESGTLRRRLRGGWQDVRHSLSKGEVVVQFAGTPGKELYGRTDAGTLVRIRGSSAALVTPGADLNAFSPAALSPADEGGVWVLGTAEIDGARKDVLARAIKGRLRLEEPLPSVAGDRYRVVVETEDGLLIASERGRVRLRSPDGTWREARVSGELPPSATRSFARSAPARAK